MRFDSIPPITRKTRRPPHPLVLLILLFLTATPAQAQGMKASAVAYVAAQASSPGEHSNATRPYASLQQALADGARILRVAPGVYAEDRLYVGGGEVVEVLPWNRSTTSVVEIRGTVIINEAATLRLGSDGSAPITVRILGDVLLPHGILELEGVGLEMGALAGATATFSVGPQSRVQATDACQGNFIRYIGFGTIEAVFETTSARPRIELPCIEIDLAETGRVTFDASGLPATTSETADHLDVLATPRFTLINAPDSAGVRLLNGLDMLDIAEQYIQRRGGLVMAGRSSIDAPAPTVQTIRTGGDFAMDAGVFLATGGAVDVGGHFFLGEDEARVASQALFSLAPGGSHRVQGIFAVGPNTDSCSAGEVGDGYENCIDGLGGPERRNRYFLDGGRLMLLGDYRFEGTADRFDDAVFPAQDQGLDGTVVFAGDELQALSHRMDEEAFFDDVVLNGGGIRLQSDVWQNSTGTLSLQRGLVDTAQKQYGWIVLNTGFETDMAERRNASLGHGVIELGSARSFIEGEVDRRIEHGSFGLSAEEGYLFPVGVRRGQSGVCSEDDTQVDCFRPLTLHFPDHLGRSSLARVELREDLAAEDLEFPDEGIVVDADDGGILILDVIADLFWQVRFDRLPAFDPTVRVVADGLMNVFDLTALRLLQWDCDGTDPRLAGVYELPYPLPPNRFNSFIDGVPVLRQKGVNAEDCQIFGIASNFGINPINFPSSDPFVWVQFINGLHHDEVVDVYVDDQRLIDDFLSATATPYIPVPFGTHKIDIVPAYETDNARPLWTSEETLLLPNDYAFITVGNRDSLRVVVQDQARREAASDDVEFFVIHDVPDAPIFDMVLLDPRVPNQLEDIILNNAAFGEVSTYRRLEPRMHDFQITNADNTAEFTRFRFDLSRFGGKTIIFLLTGRFDDGSFSIVGYDAQGLSVGPIPTSVADEAAVPETFTLRGNYPNPFNPTTRVVFDLPTPARVHLEIVDLLGRTVWTTPPQRIEAGAGRALTVEATGLASGVYLYRVVAQAATATQIRTGRMILAR